MSHASSSSQPQPRSPSEEVDDAPIAPQDVIQLKFNSVGLPFGPGSEKVPSKLGRLVRSQVSVKYKKWSDVSPTVKDGLWKDMKKAFNFSDSQRDVQMKKADDSFRKYKCKLRKLLRPGADLQTWIEAMPEKKFSPEDWLAFVMNEATPRQQAIRVRNKRNRKNSVRKSTHNTGRYGYARAEEKFKEEFGRKPLRVELWLYTHKKKDGSYAPHDEELARKFEALLEVMRQTGKVDTIDSGPIFEFFGKENRGRTRCVGPISRKSLLSSSFAREMLEEADSKHDEWANEMKTMMTENNEKLMSQVSELLEGIRNGKYCNNGSNQNPGGNYTSTNVGSGSAPLSFGESIPCKVLAHTGVVVAYGTKSPPGYAPTLNGHVMKPTESQVLIDFVTDPTYTVWGGEQDGAKTLGQVGTGSVLYWPNDLLPLV